MKTKLSDLIIPEFRSVHNAVKYARATHIWMKGGRGSTKSSFISLEIVLGIMRDAQNGHMTNAVVIRRVKDTLSGSVFEQIKWAIYKLGVQDDWNIPEAQLKITYISTGQVILFKGADKEKKLKSTKVSKGYVKYLWYEETDEFESYDKIRNINQSLLRGGPTYCVFYSYNPPKSQRNWVNREVVVDRQDKLVVHSTYLSVPEEWLGKEFIAEAEHLKKVNIDKYKHEYLGEVTGTGGEVFRNITAREITIDDIMAFDRIKQGLDFGFAGDPVAYTKSNYDKRRRRLFIFDEIYQVALSNSKMFAAIKEKNPSNKRITADSAEPRTINECRLSGINVKGAKKGPDSIDNGIKWLADLDEIIIDPIRCPNTYREFINYEIEQDKEGNLKGEYPDKDNHTIDATRYSCEDEIISAKARAKKKKINYGGK